MDYQWPQSHADEQADKPADKTPADPTPADKTDVFKPAEPTVPAVAPVVPAVAPAPVTGDEPTVRIDQATVKIKKPRKQQPRVRKLAIIGGAVVGGLALLYTLDLLLSSGDVPRGVTVEGVAVGGESHEDAAQLLRDEIGPRLTKPVSVRAGDVSTEVDPRKAGLTIDWPATIDQAGEQPLNPFTRLTSFFTDREVGIVTATDNAELTAATQVLHKEVDHEPVEGGIKFDGVTPIAIEPKQGQKLDAAAARTALIDDWARGETVELPVESTPVKTTAEGVEKAMNEIAKPAMSGDVTVHGEGKDAELETLDIARSLRFSPDGKGGLTAKIDQKKIVGACAPQLKSTEVQGKDAEIVFAGGTPTVEPSVNGRGVDWKKTLEPMIDVLKKDDDRELTATYRDMPAKVTTAAANKLGIKEVIGEFTTGGFASDSGVNIRTVAEKVDGAIVKPGDTFSLNGFTGPRTAAEGYVEAGVIQDGVPSREVGGGISQFATTLYNASYFAAMTDAGHQEHSFYISRYPAAREATVFQNHDGSSVIDLKFTNDSETGVAIQTIWAPDSITVKIWGTKHYDVESITGDKTNFTKPETKTETSPECKPSEGGDGFTATDTRIIREHGSGAEVSRDTRTVRYNSHPKIVCKPKK